MFQRVGIAVSVAAVSIFLSSIAVLADTSQVTNAQTLHLDDGFLGRPVSLKLFDGRVTISWQTGDVSKATDLTVVLTTSSQPVLSWSIPDAVKTKRISVVVKGKWMSRGTASWYKYKRCNCAASPDFPKGTKLLVRRVDKPEKSIIVRVNDFGPERDKFPDRAIDLDAVAFKALASLRAGVIEVTVEPI